VTQGFQEHLVERDSELEVLRELIASASYASCSSRSSAA
jgi:hypothetical protein